ncbi:MAG TPA: hypothetical protein VG798_06120 [Rhizomicrobium sp.]|nr:hypothetical protein [Rhizomicrobium sp.]
MNRVLVAAGLAASLIATNLMAAEVNAPLPPAKKAGVHKAQLEDLGPLPWIGLGIGAIAAVALSQDSPDPVNSTAPGLVLPSVST